MFNQKFTIICFALALTIIFSSGCALTQQGKRAEDLENQLTMLKEAIKTKELQINRIREVLDDQSKQLRDLSDKLNECKKAPVDLRKKQPNLK